MIEDASETFHCPILNEKSTLECQARANIEKLNKKFRRDCEGFTLESRQQAPQEAERLWRWSEDLIAQLLADVGLPALSDREFLVGDLFDFLPADPRESRQNVPAEFGFVRFSLRRGVTDRLHHIVSLSCRQLESHLRFQCQDQAEQTHGIRLDHSLGGSISAFNRELRRLCEDSAGRPLPLFVPAHSLERMQHGLLYVYGASADIGDCPLVRQASTPNLTRVLCLEALMRQLMTCSAMPEAHRRTVLDQQMTIELLKTRFTGYSECCQFHTAEDNTEFCALTRAHKYAWTIFELLHDRLGFELTTAHRPLDEQLLAPPVALTQQPQWAKHFSQIQSSRDRGNVTAQHPAAFSSADSVVHFGSGRGRGRYFNLLNSSALTLYENLPAADSTRVAAVKEVADDQAVAVKEVADDQVAAVKEAADKQAAAVKEGADDQAAAVKEAVLIGGGPRVPPHAAAPPESACRYFSFGRGRGFFRLDSQTPAMPVGAAAPNSNIFQTPTNFAFGRGRSHVIKFD